MAFPYAGNRERGWLRMLSEGAAEGDVTIYAAVSAAYGRNPDFPDLPVGAQYLVFINHCNAHGVEIL
jgi:hypothetical protein